MEFYREKFPENSITPKMHMLEEHVHEFINKWKIGLGMYAEQGGESIYPEFNNLYKIYSSVPCKQSRLRYVLEQHHMKVRPAAKCLVPTVKKRKISNEE